MTHIGGKPMVSMIKPGRDHLLVSLMLTSLYVLHIADPQLFELIMSTLSDAYLGVSIFIAATLAVFYALDRQMKSGLTQVLNRNSIFQVPVAALLGALPGCGGAIIVVTQFVNGQMSFGALVAVLIATMGDAAFLLLSREPQTALLVYGISLITGVLSGYLVNAIHGHHYLKSSQNKTDDADITIPRLPPKLSAFFVLMLIPSTLFGLLEAFQYDSNQLFGRWAELELVQWLGFLGAVLCISVWISQPLDSWSARFAAKNEIKYLRETVVAETSFISVWVIAGFLSYELLVYFTGLNFQAMFYNFGSLAILFAVLLGFVPGCGPQIVLTTLYLNGVVPLSAQLANAISNDGDALFPAIALAPKAAIQATLYSAVPAAIVGVVTFNLGW
ncbi:MAG: putative manganese transporter [Saccharospirillaceae bacterium]|nr:putative manganese transporter [Saccharospirillaceae bacterium]